MTNLTATAIAHPNIAFIKYWGNRDNDLRLPQNGSISMNLAGLQTHTRVSFKADLQQDRFILNNAVQTGESLARVSHFLDLVRKMAGKGWQAEIDSANNFPTGAGIASSAAAFAALAVAAVNAIGMELNEQQLSALARRGSGSACRSIPPGFVEWYPGSGDADSFAESIADSDHWPLVDCIAVLKETHKITGSSEGHQLAGTSPLQSGRLANINERLAICRAAIVSRDFEGLAQVMEADSNLMHAVMMTSVPAVFYWEPTSIAIMKAVPLWRKAGVAACYTLDAGPNVHVICTPESCGEVQNRLQAFPEVNSVLVSKAGGGAHLTAED